jgi:hypothetical protein
MVLRGQLRGRVGRRRELFHKAPLLTREAGLSLFYLTATNTTVLLPDEFVYDHEEYLCGET